MSDPSDEAMAAAIIIYSDECLLCGICVPWRCPHCYQQRCNWVERPCPRCGTTPRRQDYDTSRVRRELDELRGELEAR